MRRIGVLLGAPADEDDADAQARVVAFQQAMQQLGWTDGRNMQIDIRRGGGDATLSAFANMRLNWPRLRRKSS